MVISLGKFMKVDALNACIHRTNICSENYNLHTSHVVVSTPASVSNMIAKKLLETKFIKIFVLDEANKLLSQKINVQIKEVFKFLEDGIQVILLSVPMSKYVLDMCTHFVHNPIHIFVQKKKLKFDGMYNKPICCFFLVNFQLIIIYLAIEQFYINITKENETKNGHPSDTNNYSGLLSLDVGKTIESDWKELVDNFHDMNLKEELLRGIYAYGFERPSAIQERAILPCIKGHDVIVQADSDTGKTTSVLISILQRIDISLNKCQALILAPTRDLVQQIQKVKLVLCFEYFILYGIFFSLSVHFLWIFNSVNNI